MYVHTELPRHASIDKIREDSDVLSPQLKLSVAGRRSHHDCAFAWEYKTSDSGQPGTLEHRVHIFKSTPGQATERHVSPWHDVPLKNTDGTFNFVCEIPKETRAKMEMATGEPGNAIKQDTKKGELRYYAMNIHWNYGALPQTWEDPNHSNAELGGIFGDNDPVDVVEIGSKPLETGSIYKVKVLGVLAMIDDGELDWKVVAINAEDPLAAKLDDVPDVERECLGELTRIYEWFRDYKIPDGKPPNHFAYDGQCQPKARAMEVIEETHAFWLDLVSLPTPRWPQGLAKHAFSRTPTHFSPRPAPIAE